MKEIKVGEKTINELLKDRWHPYNEEPRNYSNIIYLNADGDIYSKQYVKVEGFRTWRDKIYIKVL